MSAIIGPNDNPAYNALVAKFHAERAVNWAQLTEEYRGYAFHLHHLALGERPATHNDIGPMYVKQALSMQRGGLKLT